MSGLTPASLNTRFSGRVANVPGAVPVTLSNPTGIGTYAVAGGNATNIVRQYLGLPLTPAGLDAASAVLARYARSDNDGVNFYDSYGTSSVVFGNLNLQKNTSNSDGGSVVANVEYDLSDQITARSISGWRHYSRTELYDIDGTPYPLIETQSGTPFADFYSEEAQLLGNMKSLKWAIGVYYSYERGLDYSPGGTLQAPGTSANTITDGLSRNTSLAAFGQASYALTNRLTVTLGARYTKEIHKIRNQNRSGLNVCFIPMPLLNNPSGPITTLANGTTGPCGTNISATFSDPSWLASLDYKLTNDVLLYGKYSRGFRGGGQQGRANTATIPASFTPYRPETVAEYETGLKSQFFDRRVRLNVAAFYDEYNDVQRTVTLLGPSGAAYTIVTNAAKARLYGFEGEGEVRLGGGVSINGSVGYLNAKYLTFMDAALGDRSGEDWPAPRWNYSVTARYEKSTGVGPLTALVQWVWKSKTNYAPQSFLTSETTQPAFGLLNGSIGLRFESAGFEASLYGRNLLGKHFYSAATGLDSLGFNELVVGDPRTFGIQLTKRFGGER
jgi:iron complex outermembrane receptor protein